MIPPLPPLEVEVEVIVIHQRQGDATAQQVFLQTQPFQRGQAPQLGRDFPFQPVLAKVQGPDLLITVVNLNPVPLVEGRVGQPVGVVGPVGAVRGVVQSRQGCPVPFGRRGGRGRGWRRGGGGRWRGSRGRQRCRRGGSRFRYRLRRCRRQFRRRAGYCSGRGRVRLDNGSGRLRRGRGRNGGRGVRRNQRGGGKYRRRGRRGRGGGGGRRRGCGAASQQQPHRQQQQAKDADRPKEQLRGGG